MVEAPVLSPAARPLRLLVFVSKAAGLSPGQRFRLEQWAPRVRATSGIELELVPFESPELTALLYLPGRRAEKAARVLLDFARRALPVARARSYDAVVLYREAALLGPAIYERLLKRLGVPVLLDFDDAIWNLQTSKANGIFSRLHFYGKTKTLCRLADGVIVGNDYLAEYARGVGAKNVFVVPTSIELDRYPVHPESLDRERFVVAWSGSISTLAHFEHARPALEALARRRPITVKIICNEPPARPIAGAENVFVRWTETGEAATLADAHVGVMPLPDTAFTRGKCGLKALQFMSVGRPVVVSPVGMNRELIKSGENGYLADTVEEWLAALDGLASSPALRARIGMEGRQTVEDRYSAAVVSRLFASAVRTTLG